MNRSLTTVFLAIAPEKQLLLLHRLAPETQSVITECVAPTHLLAHLQQQGWDAELGQDGAIYVTASQHSVLDIEQNPLLQQAAGCVSAGSVVQGYGEANEQWQLRYADNACTLVKGGVVFPALSTWEQQTRAPICVIFSPLPQMDWRRAPDRCASLPLATDRVERRECAEKSRRKTSLLSSRIPPKR